MSFARRASQRWRMHSMARVRLRGPLKTLAGDGDLPVAGVTVAELLGTLERERPALHGWILDERGRVRRHINVFVNGEQAGADTPVTGADRVDVLPAISGGCPGMTEVLVATKRGLFVREGERGGGEPFRVSARAFAGEPVEYA